MDGAIQRNVVAGMSETGKIIWFVAKIVLVMLALLAAYGLGVLGILRG